MTYEELMSIIQLCDPDRWLREEGRGLFTCKDDLDIRIARCDDDEGGWEFHEPWVERISGAWPTWLNKYEIHYRASYVDSFCLVWLSGVNVSMPIPRPGTDIIPRDKCRYAEIVTDDRQLLHQTIQAAGLSMEERT